MVALVEKDWGAGLSSPCPVSGFRAPALSRGLGPLTIVAQVEEDWGAVLSSPTAYNADTSPLADTIPAAVSTEESSTTPPLLWMALAIVADPPSCCPSPPGKVPAALR